MSARSGSGQTVLVTIPELSGGPFGSRSGGPAVSVPPPTRSATGPHAHDPLATLVRAVAAGDQASFAQVYDALAPMVHGTAWRVLRDPDLAADVTQEVMLEVWRDAPRYAPERGSVRAWVATTAHRRAVDRVRSVQAQRNRDDQDATTAYRPAYDEVTEEVQRRADRDEVRGCLESLTDLQRAVVVLAYFGGRTYREVADELETPLPTVKSRIRDGLNRLRTCLGVQ